MENIMNSFFHYCYEGDLINAQKIYHENYPYINIRWKNDKIFKFCCKAAQDMDGYNEIFTKQAKNIIQVILFIRNLCKLYHIQIENDKLIDWKIQKQISIII